MKGGQDGSNTCLTTNTIVLTAGNTEMLGTIGNISLIDIVKQAETLGIVGVLALLLILTWFWVIPKLWKCLNEKDAQIAGLTDTVLKLTNTLDHGDLKTQAVVIDESKRLSEKVSSVHTCVSSVDSYVRGALGSSGSGRKGH